jgi:hypothetical protein
MAFARQALLRKAAVRTYGDLGEVIGTVCHLFPGDECSNDFIATGCKPN